MLQRDQNSQRLYAHDVVTEKETSNVGSEHLNTTGSSNNNGNLFITDILLNALNVNGIDAETAQTKYALRDKFREEVQKFDAESQKIIKDANMRMQYSKSAAMTEKRFNDAASDMQYGETNKAKGYSKISDTKKP